MPAEPPEAVRTIGSRVRARRNELGLSLEEAAPRCGVHWSALGHIERGQRNMSVVTLLRIAHGLDIDPGDLVAGVSL
jgi:transcriptional regulator with XRE-family HTH domain